MIEFFKYGSEGVCCFFLVCYARSEPGQDFGNVTNKHPCDLVLQVTFLKCGGVAVGTGMHHVTMDGAGAIQFIRTWTSLARGLDAASVSPSPPCHERTLLRARSPPSVTSEHPVYSPSNLNGMPRPFVTTRS